MGTATLVVVCHYLLHAKHFLLLRGQQHGERGENVGTVAETFHTPMGTATTGMPVASASCCETFHTPTGTVTFAVIHRRTLRRNISYLYGDSNPHEPLPACRDSAEAFHTPMGTATRQTPPHGSDWRKHFIPLWGQQPAVMYLAVLGLPGNISYPYGDSNAGAQCAAAFPPAETFHPPTGTATVKCKQIQLIGNETFHTPMGTATPW